MGSVVDDSNKEATELVADQQKETTDSVEMKNEIICGEIKDESLDAEKSENEIVCGEIKDESLDAEKSESSGCYEKKYRVVFVMGGPGGGKSTQCANISKQIGFTHLSSGDLLRKAILNDPENGSMIQRMIKEGESVPPELTMIILMKAMEQSGNDKFLLDGFPRDDEIRAAFESATKTEPELVLFFECSEEEREKRILSRNQGREDDNPDSLRKRFKYFEENTLPVIEYYRSKGKVFQVDASKPMEEVFDRIKILLTEAVAHVEAAEPEDLDLEKHISNMKL